MTPGREVTPGPVLLLGNGPNQLAGAKSWSDLIQDLRRLVGVRRAPGDDATPFPLLYERFFLQGFAKFSIKESELKQRVADHAGQMQAAEIHKKIANVGFGHVLTTNYDHSLEEASGTATDVSKNQGVVVERRYNLFRHHSVEHCSIWHIHGDCEHPDSITLGYEHYSGYLQQMRSYVTQGLSYAHESFPALVADLRKGRVEGRSWVDFFFDRDVYIVGLSLDFIEFHLWWLLTFRARLYPVSDIPVSNRIVYIFRGDTGDTGPGDEAKYAMMRANHIELVKVDGGTDGWSGYYDRVVRRLRRALTAQ